MTPGQLNDFIGKALKGDTRYRQFKGNEGQLMSAGLIGPVVIRPRVENVFPAWLQPNSI